MKMFRVAKDWVDRALVLSGSLASSLANAGTQASARAPNLRCLFLGEFRAFLGGQPLSSWPSKKGRFIFAFLALNHGRKICRDILMETFWPNTTAESARNCLNVTLHGVRRLLSAFDASYEYILFKDECYFLNPEIEVSLDVDEFKKAWREGQQRERENRIQDALRAYERAAETYTGDLLEEILYEDWLISERDHLKEVYLVILDKISSYYSLDGKPQTAIELCERMLDKDICQEEVHRRLMKCYNRIGLRDRALKQFRRCAEVMKRELEAEPTAETRDLYEEIKAQTETEVESG